MSLIRSLAIATVFALALGAFGQTAPSTADHAQSSASARPNVDQHLQALSQGLDLTADQQAKIRPILRNFLDTREKVLADSSLSGDERQQRIKAMHEKADLQVRKFLNDEQKQKLTQLEQEHQRQQ
jgi:Spy/CpxP family protein refolding chaperone